MPRLSCDSIAWIPGMDYKTDSNMWTLPGGGLLRGLCRNKAAAEYGTGSGGKEGCDGWGEPAELCVSPKDEWGAEPSWLTDFPAWLEFKFFEGASETYMWWIEAEDPSMFASDGKTERTSIGFVFKYTNYIVIFLVILGILVAAIKMALQRDGRPGKELVKNLLMFVITTGMLLAVNQAILLFVRRFFNWYVREGLGGAGGQRYATMEEALTKNMGAMLQGVNPAGFGLIDLLAALLVICLSIVMYIYMTMRYLLVMLRTAMTPMYAAWATVSERGKQGLWDNFWRLLSWDIGIVFIAIALVAGFQEIGELRADEMRTGETHYWRGLIFFGLATVAGPSTAYAMAPMLDKGAAGNTSANVGAFKTAVGVGAAVVGAGISAAGAGAGGGGGAGGAAQAGQQAVNAATNAVNSTVGGFGGVADDGSGGPPPPPGGPGGPGGTPPGGTPPGGKPGGPGGGNPPGGPGVPPGPGATPAPRAAIPGVDGRPLDLGIPTQDQSFAAIRVHAIELWERAAGFENDPATQHLAPQARQLANDELARSRDKMLDDWNEMGQAGNTAAQAQLQADFDSLQKYATARELGQVANPMTPRDAHLAAGNWRNGNRSNIVDEVNSRISGGPSGGGPNP